MDQNAALLNARRFAANAYDGEVETIRRQYQLKLDEECARLAARGLGTSSHLVLATVGLECERIKAMTQLRLNGLMEGCDLYGVEVDDFLGASLQEEVMKEMGQLIDTAQRNVLAGIPRSTQSNYPQLIAEKIGDPQAWVATQIDRWRLTPKKSGAPSVTTIYNVKGDNARFNTNSTDNSVNVVTTTSEDFFADLRGQIESEVPEGDERKKIVESLTELQASHGKPSFAQRYTDFMAAAANHIKVIAPFIPALTEMLHHVLK
jgi:hypothetical protein